MDQASELTNQFKQGYKTTEFWLVLSAAAYNAIVLAFDPNRPLEEQWPGLAWAGLAAVYAVARTMLKRSRTTAVASVVQPEAAETSPPAPQQTAEVAVIGEHVVDPARRAGASRPASGSLVSIPASAVAEPAVSEQPARTHHVMDPAELLHDLAMVMLDAGMIDEARQDPLRERPKGDR